MLRRCSLLLLIAAGCYGPGPTTTTLPDGGRGAGTLADGGTSFASGDPGALCGPEMHATRCAGDVTSCTWTSNITGQGLCTCSAGVWSCASDNPSGSCPAPSQTSCGGSCSGSVSSCLCRCGGGNGPEFTGCGCSGGKWTCYGKCG